MPLHRRPGLKSFYARLIIPATFRSLFDGRREIQKALGTHDRTVALLRESVWSMGYILPPAPRSEAHDDARRTPSPHHAVHHRTPQRVGGRVVRITGLREAASL